mmetsp:Transcript_2549/g.3763  ORF Transcript_2549/g.3763 Transcript_2549/m.3763 type:complete len:248 (+) Transcript_2549:5378-6121(+)
MARHRETTVGRSATFSLASSKAAATSSTYLERFRDAISRSISAGFMVHAAPDFTFFTKAVHFLRSDFSFFLEASNSFRRLRRFSIASCFRCSLRDSTDEMVMANESIPSWTLSHNSFCFLRMASRASCSFFCSSSRRWRSASAAAASAAILFSSSLFNLSSSDITSVFLPDPFPPRWRFFPLPPRPLTPDSPPRPALPLSPSCLPEARPLPLPRPPLEPPPFRPPVRPLPRPGASAIIERADHEIER